MKNVCILFFWVLCNVALAQIINFPDPNFKNALVNTKCVDTDGINGPDVDADLNNDGEIDVMEASQIDSLFLHENNIDNVQGIEFFKNLELFAISKNNIIELVVDSLIHLRNLICSDNYFLTSLNVSN